MRPLGFRNIVSGIIVGAMLPLTFSMGWGFRDKQSWNDEIFKEAAQDNFLAEVKKSLEKGINVNTKDENGKTILHWAVFLEQREAVELLIAKGADVNAKTDAGLTPLNLAEEKGKKNIVELLKKHGAK